MRAVVQRVREASVSIDEKVVGCIKQGLMVLIGVEVGDGENDLKYMQDKIQNLRIFEDENHKMNLSLLDIKGELLVVSQFTLFGDARGGRRPSFIAAARPEEAIPLYENLIKRWRENGIHVQEGVFGADMQVSLINDGPVTILLESHKQF